MNPGAATAHVPSRKALEDDLAVAIDRGQLVVHYQPEVDLHTGEIIGVECLLRWHHPVHGLIAPDRFIPLAEASGLIGALGTWTLTQACETMRRLQREVAGTAQLQLNVNVSPQQLTGDFVGEVARITAGTGITRSRLVLEITENTLVHDVPTAETVLRQLHRLGVQLAIDDFGIGYAALSYLLDLPIGVIKIDKSFIGRLHEPAGNAIVSSVIKLARTLGLSVTAEGVETSRQQHHLRKLGCVRGQGFLFARPLPEASLRQLLERHGCATHPATSAGRPRQGWRNRVGNGWLRTRVQPVTTP